jgi:hypothetical protein
MTSTQKTEVKLAPELEAIATAACDQLCAKTDGDPKPEERLQRGVGDAAGRAIAAGLSLTAIADAERIGHARAREQLGHGDPASGPARLAAQARGRAHL